MQLTNNNILLASLLGSKSVQQISDFGEIQKVLEEKNLPLLPAIQMDKSGNIWESDKPLPESKQFFPFTFKNVEGSNYLLPFEPLLSISSKNEIVKSDVAKGNRIIIGADGSKRSTIFEGTIKERFSRGDFDLRLSGVLIGPKLIGRSHETFPKDDFSKLNRLLCKAQKWEVFCEPLSLLGITYVVVESFNFPFSKGENLQAYEINLTSDFEFNLELTENDVKQS